MKLTSDDRDKHHNTEWGKLRLQIANDKDVDDMFRCPFCPQLADRPYARLPSLLNHMLSDFCNNYKENVEMKAEFDKTNAKTITQRHDYYVRSQQMAKARRGQGPVDHSDFPIKATSSTMWNVLETSAVSQKQDHLFLSANSFLCFSNSTLLTWLSSRLILSRHSP